MLYNATTINPTTELVFRFIKALRADPQWKNEEFLQSHTVQLNFIPRGVSVGCSDHFTDECFQRAVHVEGSQRSIIPLSILSIWEKRSGKNETKGP